MELVQLISIVFCNTAPHTSCGASQPDGHMNLNRHSMHKNRKGLYL